MILEELGREVWELNLLECLQRIDSEGQKNKREGNNHVNCKATKYCGQVESCKGMMLQGHWPFTHGQTDWSKYLRSESIHGIAAMHFERQGILERK